MGNKCCGTSSLEDEDEDEDRFDDAIDETFVKGKNSSQPHECCICLELLVRKEAILNPCVHNEFHESCITSWLKQKNVCPLCDQRIEAIIFHDNESNGYRISRRPSQAAEKQIRLDAEFARRLFLNDLILPSPFDFH